MTTGKRRQYYVDTKVQGALLGRTAIYWCFCVVAIMLMLLAWRVTTEPAQPFAAHLVWFWTYNAPAMLASCLLLPILMIDTLRLSNRFAGPMIRLRRAMVRLADGERVEPVNFRDNDFWKSFADDFNRVLARIECERQQAAGSQGATQRVTDLTGNLEHDVERELSFDFDDAEPIGSK